MNFGAWLQFGLGLALVLGGAELLVRGAAGLARSFGISSLVIGLTVVALGTSSPELAVGLRSSLAGNADVAIGNVVGSNIFNVLLILGVASLLLPLTVASQLVRWDVPLMIAISALLWALGADGRLGRVEGGLLAAGLVAYMAWSVRLGRREAAVGAPSSVAPPPVPLPSRPGLDVLMVVIGLALLVVGADRLVGGAVEIASALGMSDLVIGLTLVAGGTSLPELATTVVACRRREGDIAVGNVVGSNLFNILGVAGLSAVAAPAGLAVPAPALRVDMPVMIAAALACLPVFFTGKRIARWEGALFLACYVAYTAYLVLTGVRSPALAAFNRAMLLFAVPLVVMTLGGSAARERFGWGSGRRRGARRRGARRRGSGGRRGGAA